jgi:hypothetical protein
MKTNMAGNTFLCAALLLACSFLRAQPNDSIDVKPLKPEKSRTLPFGADWAKKKGIDLPAPFGISTFFTYMGRSVEITDVTVEFGGRDPESVSEFGSFAVKNQTYVAALKFDAWILPFLNVYALGGYAYTDGNLIADLSIDRAILPLPPVEMNLNTSSIVKGPYTGLGTTVVAGYKNWFILADANYGITWPDLVSNSLTFTMLSLRSGLSGKIGDDNPMRAWLGAAYMNSKCTIIIEEESDVLGEVIVAVEQQPVNPWTYQCGFSVGVGKYFEVMTELGSNFDDASILVLNVAYRF